jgi:hypothetical protein
MWILITRRKKGSDDYQGDPHIGLIIYSTVVEEYELNGFSVYP